MERYCSQYSFMVPGGRCLTGRSLRWIFIALLCPQPFFRRGLDALSSLAWNALPDNTRSRQSRRACSPHLAAQVLAGSRPHFGRFLRGRMLRRLRTCVASRSLYEDSEDPPEGHPPHGSQPSGSWLRGCFLRNTGMESSSQIQQCA